MYFLCSPSLCVKRFLPFLDISHYQNTSFDQNYKIEIFDSYNGINFLHFVTLLHMNLGFSRRQFLLNWHLWTYSINGAGPRAGVPTFCRKSSTVFSTDLSVAINQQLSM